MKNWLSIPLLAIMCIRVWGQHEIQDWSEPADPCPVSEADWKDIKGLNASFVSIDVRFPRSQPFKGTVLGQTQLVGWKGEKLSAQLLVWTAEEVESLQCNIGDFIMTGGPRLKGIARARFVKYVLSDYFNKEKPCGMRRPGEPSHLEADLLDEVTSLRIPSNTARPIWITIDVPRDAKAGTYLAEIDLEANGGRSRTLSIELIVIDRVLPPPSEWSYHLDLWQHPAAVARVHGVPLWSAEHFQVMEPLMKMLADAGQKVITATLNKDPWNNQCYDAYADMIIWIKNGDGSWEYDFTIFDRWVEFMMRLGINKMINAYSMLPWNNMLHYKDATTGQFVDVKADPGTPEFIRMWTPFLAAFQKHLEEKGWLEITNIAMDERSPEFMAEATALLDRIAPKFGVALADNHKIFKKYPYIKDMCAAIFGPIERADILERRAKGLNTTFYVCCSSEFPNTYTFSDPAEAVYLAWYAAAHEYDGFLRWTYNSWTEDPIRDSRFRQWSAGDTYIVYPGGRSSIRFERLIEGIQDWEKIQILRHEFSSDRGKVSEEKLKRLEAALENFGSSNRFNGWNECLNQAKHLLNNL